MSPDLGVIPAAVLVFAVTALTAALAGVAAWAALARVLRGLPPATQAGLLLGFAAAPALAGLTLLVLALSPSLAHLMGLAADHCHGHAHHAHFCPTHSPLWTGGAADWLILAAAGAAVVPFSARLLARLVRVRRVVRTLEAAEVPAAGPRPYRVVDADAPVAVTAGLIRPRIYLSSHLLAALAPAELAAVVGHEQAHQRRRDALRLLAAEVLAGLHLPRVRRRLLVDLALATERACDEAAARAQVDRLTVAAALLAVTRLGAPRPMSPDGLLPTVAGADLTARVEALLRPLPVPRVRPWYPVTAAAGALLTIGSIHAAELHHGIESALHVLID